MMPKQTYGVFEFSGTLYLITSPIFQEILKREKPLGSMSWHDYKRTFLGPNTRCLIDREGRIVGWDARALNNYNQAAGRV